MSATPEQIAIDEKALARAKNVVPFGWTGFHDEHFRAVLGAYLSATKDAQAEKVRVLEEALKEARFFLSMLDGSCRASVHGYCNVNVPVDHLETVTAKVRAALKATGAPQ